MTILTDVWSITAVVLAALLAGAGSVYWLFRKRRTENQPNDKAEKEILYLIFSRVSHRLKTASEVIRGHLHSFGGELPRDAERWKVARDAINEEAAGINSLIERLDLLVRLGMERQPLIIEPVNLTRMLEDLMVELGPAADAKGILLGGLLLLKNRASCTFQGTL